MYKFELFVITAPPLHTHIMQLVNIGSQYSYSSDDQSEFLVVVSKEFDDPPERSQSKPTNKEKVSPSLQPMEYMYLWCQPSLPLPCVN